MHDPFNGKLLRSRHPVGLEIGSGVVTMSFDGASLTLHRGQCMQLASDLLRGASLAGWNAAEDERARAMEIEASDRRRVLEKQAAAGIPARIGWPEPAGHNCVAEEVLLRFVNGRVQQWYSHPRYVKGVETDGDGWGPPEYGDNWLGIRRISFLGKKTHAVQHDGWHYKPLCGAQSYGDRWEDRTLYEGLVEVTCKRCKAIEAAAPKGRTETPATPEGE